MVRRLLCWLMTRHRERVKFDMGPRGAGRDKGCRCLRCGWTLLGVLEADDDR